MTLEACECLCWHKLRLCQWGFKGFPLGSGWVGQHKQIASGNPTSQGRFITTNALFLRRSFLHRSVHQIY